jgi:DNA-binding Lrp family transcriptional regulator
MVGTESGEMDAVDSKLILALWADARASVIDLAATTNLSSSVTRRRLQRLLDSGQAILRCDFNRQLVGWPVTILYFATIAPDHLAATQRLLRKLPEVHTSIHTAGPHNLVIDVCLRSLTDCSVSLCFVKYLGRLVDEKGNCVGSVPMDIS